MVPKLGDPIWAGCGPPPSESNILFVLISLCSRDSLPYARGVGIHWREKKSCQAKKEKKKIQSEFSLKVPQDTPQDTPQVREGS